MLERSALIRRFAVRFVLYWLLALAILAAFPAIERSAVRATVAILSLLFDAVGFEHDVKSSVIHLSQASIEIVSDCTPVMPTAALWAAMLAFPAPGRWKLLGVTLGLTAMWLFNIARVSALAAVLELRPRWFEFVHVYLWQAITMAVVLSAFIVWVRFTPVPKRRGP